MSTPNDEAQAVDAALGFRTLPQTNSIDSAPRCALDQAPGYPARLARAQAAYASKGFALHPLGAESVIVSVWGMHRVLPDLKTAEQTLEKIGGARG